MTTPHVLTEVSNFVDQAPVRWRSQLIQALRYFTLNQDEAYQQSASLVVFEEFERLALADTALLSLSPTVTVATLDYELYGRIIRKGGRAVHFDHVRRSASR